MVAWWSIRDKRKRAAAKAADASERAERLRLIELSGGGVKEVTLDGRTGFVNSKGAFWPFATKAERRVARQFAQSGLYPSPLLRVLVEGNSVSLKGLRSGTVYSCDVSNGYTLRPHYRAAVKMEARCAATRDAQ